MTIPLQHLLPPDSVIARFDPRWKLSAILLAVIAFSLLHSLATIGAALGVAMLLVLAAQLDGRWVRVRIAVLVLVLLPFLFILPFTIDHGGPKVEYLGITLCADGLLTAARLFLRTIAMVMLILVLLGSTRFTDLLRAAQRLHIPQLLIQLTALTYRYIFLLADELNRLRIALRVRGYRNRMNRHSYRTIGHVTGTLIVRGAERAERVAEAMRCRGFDGTFRSLDEFHTKAKDVLLFVLILGTAAGLLLWDLLA